MFGMFAIVINPVIDFREELRVCKLASIPTHFGEMVEGPDRLEDTEYFYAM
ncbi:MAG TPA: hypothetical protein PKI14_13195 [Fervidobacterium sp.]|nr:hypothetical protein [Fervidobacterium sp.]HOM74759.1 hypothetical protein [Fervidobacterium sp.]HOQ40346.1 hypothetical protein [Fervidobacterium sp.]HPP18288.1 hypothetical protein [Fervidobacterium sp.]HPT54863.1 hypothetical protein [Fervidobacterium sp.]